EIGQLRRRAVARDDADERRWLDEALAQADDHRAAAGDRERAEALIARDRARRAAGDIEAIDAARAGIVDRAEQRIRFGRPHQTVGRTIPILGQAARRTCAAVVQ